VFDNGAEHRLANFPVPTLILDKDGAIIQANTAACELLESVPQNLSPRRLSEFLPLFVPSDLADRLENSPKKCVTDPFEFTTKGGATKLIDVKGTAWFSEDKTRCYTIVLQDVTQQHSAERSLRDTLNYWNSALSGANIGLFDVDLATGQSTVSDKWLSLMGISNDGVDAQAEWSKRVHPNDLPIVQASDAACIAGTLARSVADYRLRTPNGKNWLWMRSEAVVPARDAAGKALRLVGVQTDITQVKVAEDALRLSRRQFQSAFKSAPIGNAMLDVTGRFLHVNPAICQMFNNTEVELLNSSIRSLIHPDDFKECIKKIRDLRNGIESTFSMESRCVRSDSSLLWGQLSVALVRNEDGQPDQIILQIMDLTEQRTLDAAKRDFLATVSHELRTPLTSIFGSLDLLETLSTSELSDENLRLLVVALKNCDLLKHLINDILDFEKYSSLKMRISASPQKLAPLLEQSVLANTIYAKEHGVSLTLPKIDRNIVCNIDPERFQQVLTNLLSNAAKFAKAGSSVKIETESLGEFEKVSVSNLGQTIPADLLETIFQPFSQLGQSLARETKGTGLGLSISKVLVERMGGKIGVTSNAGETIFWFTLPYPFSSSFGDPVGR